MFIANKLMINVSKNKCMLVIGKNRSRNNFRVDNQVLTEGRPIEYVKKKIKESRTKKTVNRSSAPNAMK